MKGGSYVIENAYIVFVCSVVGTAIKNCTNINNKYIPTIVAIIGAILGIIVFYCDGREENAIEAMVNGIFSDRKSVV